MTVEDEAGNVMSNWDLTAVLADRQMPTAVVNVYLNEYASHAKSQLMKAHATAKPEGVEELDAKIAEVDKALQESKYEVHLEAIPSRMREDIHSRALHEYPNKRNVVGQPADDDPTIERIKYENDLLWVACIRKLVTPSGDVFEAPTKDDVTALSSGLSSSACILIDQKIQGLHQDSERYTADSKNPDF